MPDTDTTPDAPRYRDPAVQMCELLAQTNDGTLHDAAQLYASCGVPVLPLHDTTAGECSCGMPGCRSRGKHPRIGGGLTAATIDFQTIARWWDRWPTSNIGAVTGVRFEVLDVDVKHGAPGLGSLYQAKLAGLLAGRFAVAATPTGGLHLLFAPGQLGNHIAPQLGLDVRGRGGYIVASPSVIDGRAYQWQMIDATAYGHPLPWSEIRQLLDPPPTPRTKRPRAPISTETGSTSLTGLARALAETTEGGRNARLYSSARAALDEGHTDLSELEAAARAAGLPDHEIDRTIDSARRARRAWEA